MSARALRRLCFLLLSLLLAAAAPGSGHAQSDQGRAARAAGGDRPLPRFVSLRAPKVNLRTGPGVRYPIEWVYARTGVPLEVIDEFDTWRRVRDWQGSTGWVHQSMLTGERGAMVIGGQRLLRREPREDASGVALVEPGVIGRLSRCRESWCRIEVKGFEGWLRREEFYGTYPDETVE